MAKHKVAINTCYGKFELSGKELPSFYWAYWVYWDYLFGGVLAPNGRIYCKTDKGYVSSSSRIQGLTTIDPSKSLNCLNT